MFVCVYCSSILNTVGMPSFLCSLKSGLLFLGCFVCICSAVRVSKPVCISVRIVVINLQVSQSIGSHHDNGAC